MQRLTKAGKGLYWLGAHKKGIRRMLITAMCAKQLKRIHAVRSAR